MHYTDHLLREHNARAARGVLNYQRRCAAEKLAKPTNTSTMSKLRALLARPTSSRSGVRQQAAR